MLDLSMERKRMTGKISQNAAEQGERIQSEIDRKESSKPKGKQPSGPAQTGQRDYPEKFTEQHLKKPGVEADLDVAPMYQAPEYRGSEKLKDMVAVITGGDSGIGRAVAVLYAREGADVAIIYLPEEQVDAEATLEAVEAEGQRGLP